MGDFDRSNKVRDNRKHIAGDRPTPADLFSAPGCFLVKLIEEVPRVFDVPGFRDWGDGVDQLDSHRAMEPQLG